MFGLNHLFLHVFNLAAQVSAYNFGAVNSALACSFEPTSELPGFTVNLFDYPYSDDATYRDSNFLDYQYWNTNFVTSINVNDINFDIQVSGNNPQQGEIYGQQTFTTNFTAEIITFFYSRDDGYHRILLRNVDGFASLQFWYTCLRGQEKRDLQDSFSSLVSSESLQNDLGAEQYYYQYLEKGYYYPIKIIYANAEGSAVLDFSIETPSGSVVQDASSGQFFQSEIVMQAERLNNLYISTTFGSGISSWTGSLETVSTEYPTSGTEGVSIVSLIPDPTTTVTSYYDSPSSSSVFATPTGAGTWTETILIPKNIVTSNVPWTGSETISTTIIPTDPEIAETIVLGIPDPRATTSLPWTGSEISSTTIYPNPGTNGTITIEIFTPTSASIISSSSTTGNISLATTASQSVTFLNFTDSDTTSLAATSSFSNTIILQSALVNSTTNVIAGDSQNVDSRDIVTQYWTGTITSTTYYCPNNDSSTSTIVLIPCECTAFPSSVSVNEDDINSQLDIENSISTSQEVPNNNFSNTIGIPFEYSNNADKSIIFSLKLFSFFLFLFI